jgi:hypothetical protein
MDIKFKKKGFSMEFQLKTTIQEGHHHRANFFFSKHLTEIIAGVFLRWSSKCVCFCVNQKSKIADTTGHNFNIGPYWKIK